MRCNGELTGSKTGSEGLDNFCGQENAGDADYGVPRECVKSLERALVRDCCGRADLDTEAAHPGVYFLFLAGSQSHGS